MIYVDSLERWGSFGYHGKDADQAQRVGARNDHMWCHMFADKADCVELHEFARRVGLHRAWFQGDHYDLTPSRRRVAVALGARQVTRVEAVSIWRSYREKKMTFSLPPLRIGTSKLPPLPPRTVPAKGLLSPPAAQVVEPERPVVLTPDEYAKHKSSKKENYCTPAPFLEVVTELGPIGLDPCSNEHSLTCAKVEYRFDKGQDGLVLPWSGFGLVFVNCPYGRKTGAWLRRMSAMGDQGVEIVGLVAARPDTIEFQNCTAPLVCFWRGRLIFLDGDTGLPPCDAKGKPTGAIFPQAVLYWGPQRERFTELFTYDAKRPKGQRGGRVVPWGGG